MHSSCHQRTKEYNLAALPRCTTLFFQAETLGSPPSLSVNAVLPQGSEARGPIPGCLPLEMHAATPAWTGLLRTTHNVIQGIFPMIVTTLGLWKVQPSQVQK